MNHPTEEVQNPNTRDMDKLRAVLRGIKQLNWQRNPHKWRKATPKRSERLMRSYMRSERIKFIDYDGI